MTRDARASLTLLADPSLILITDDRLRMTAYRSLAADPMSTLPAHSRLHAHVYGLVQGVFFRDTTRQQARGLGLTGWVRNLADGSVEVTAEGPRAALESLLEFLHTGPSHARVDRVDPHWSAATGEFTAFDVSG